ncbi:MAG: YtxH domain-containing protein [Bacteroidia bacterium]|nr:YtxH domain-containing protein [Bacteroidia bacterium]MDW8333271.1 YtxH domain-containing protein [Bacteroidia bacterium]
MSNRSLLIFLGGVAVGAVAGILLAPDSGKNTRDKLSYQIEKQLEQLRMLLAGGKTSASDEPRRSETQSHDYRKAQELLREVENLLDEVKSKST